MTSNLGEATYPPPEGPRMAVIPLVGKSILIGWRMVFPDDAATEETRQYPSSLMSDMAYAGSFL